jgi:hypothetical protein
MPRLITNSHKSSVEIAPDMTSSFVSPSSRVSAEYERHAGDSAQLAADLVVRELRQLRHGQARGRERERDDRQIVRVEPLDDRLEDLLRQLAPDRRDGVADVLRRLVHGLLEHEHDDDLREPIRGRRVDLVDPADARQPILDAVHDLALDDIGRGTRVAHADEDDRRLNVREFVDLQFEQGRDAFDPTDASIVTTVTMGRLMAKSEMNTGFL